MFDWTDEERNAPTSALKTPVHTEIVGACLAVPGPTTGAGLPGRRRRSSRMVAEEATSQAAVEKGEMLIKEA
jgi:hypothetical protein